MGEGLVRAGQGPGERRGLTGRRSTLKLAKLLLEHLVAMLQLFVLAGQLAQLVFQLLDPHRRIGIIAILLLSHRRKRGRNGRRHHGDPREAGKRGRGKSD